MEKTGASAVGESSQEQAPSGGPLSPARAFALVLAVAVVAAAVLYLSNAREDRAAPAAAPVTPDLSLTDAEAIAQWEDLYGFIRAAYRDRDLTLMSEALTTDSPMRPRMIKGIRGIIRDRVLYKTGYDTKSISVTSNLPNLIQLRQVVLVSPRIVDEFGKDVTLNPVVERRVVEWLMRLEGTKWLLHEGTIVKAEVIDRNRNEATR